MLKRRHFLALGGVTGGALLIPATRSVLAGAQEPLPHPHGTHRPGVRGAAAAPTVAPFTVAMPVAPVLRPLWSGPDFDVYRVDISKADVDILPGLRTQAITYNGGLIGPTIRTRTGRAAKVLYTNRMDEQTNVHLHGGHVAAADDGHPVDLIDPSRSRLYHYPNQQQGATLWYHDHAHHLEAEHVYRGLHGMYVIEDPAERSLRLPSGAYDVPILLRDALFDDKGQFVSGTDPADRGTLLANGKPTPYFAVAARKYRLRFLNAANERIFQLNLGGAELALVATDNGLRSTPLRLTEFSISSGERVDVVVDFGRYPVGTSLVLADATGGPVIRFDVARTAADDSVLPDQLRAAPALPAATATREVTLGFDFANGFPVGQVNGRPYDPARSDFVIKQGTTEIWNVVNLDEFPHNFHLHMVPFRVLEWNGAAPGPQLTGRKDTVVIPPKSSARIQATFEGFLGKYAYHCHFLEHASLGMMAQMEIVE
jgi:FtsP/CotA-like multicopper oxidase with cupredoxin domain